MKTTRIASILAAAALTTTLWASAAMALSFDITGYTAGTDAFIDGGPGDVNGVAAGAADTFTGAAGKYTISFTGADYSNLKASMTIAGDGSSSVTSYNSGIFKDIFSITLVDNIFSLSSNLNGSLMMLDLAAQANSPDVPVNFTSAFANTVGGQQYAYVNRVYEQPILGADGLPLQDVNGMPVVAFESYDINGNLTSPTTGYGLLMQDWFIATTAYDITVDMTIEDANVPVPEPGTFILFGAGVAGLAFWRRRKA